jgi:hypothetical protein
MKQERVSHEIKYNKFQVIAPAVAISLVVIEPIRRLIIQGINFHEYYWFVLCFFLAAFIFWNFIRPGIHALAGVPAIIMTSTAIAITEKGYEIAWNDIDEINLMENTGKTTTYTLAISVKDDWKYIGGLRNPFFRYYRWYMKDYNQYTPFSISLNMLADSSHDIYAMVENCFHNHKNSLYDQAEVNEDNPV